MHAQAGEVSVGEALREFALFARWRRVPLEELRRLARYRLEREPPLDLADQRVRAGDVLAKILVVVGSPDVPEQGRDPARARVRQGLGLIVSTRLQQTVEVVARRALPRSRALLVVARER